MTRIHPLLHNPLPAKNSVSYLLEYTLTSGEILKFFFLKELLPKFWLNTQRENKNCNIVCLQTYSQYGDTNNWMWLNEMETILLYWFRCSWSFIKKVINKVAIKTGFPCIHAHFRKWGRKGALIREGRLFDIRAWGWTLIVRGECLLERARLFVERQYLYTIRNWTWCISLPSI